MPGLTQAKELEEDQKKIEDDPVTAELDNLLQEEGGSADQDAEVEDEKSVSESKEEEKKEEQEEEKEEEKEEEEVSNFKIEKDNLVDPATGASGDLKEELSEVDPNTASNMPVTEEEKDAAHDTSQSDIFDTNTGATQAADTSAETEVNTGATKGFSKTKRFFFSIFSGLKKAKKGISNFFTKKIPSAAKATGEFSKKMLKYTPVAPLVTLIEKKQAEKEKTRPERERKAKEKEKEKKEKWLLEQDEKRHKKEEEKRIKEEKEKLEAQQKAAQAEWEKEHNTLKYRTGKFFKGIWDGIKTGASWIGNRIKNSQIGYYAKIVATKTIPAVKKIVDKTKMLVGGVIAKVVGKIEQIKDEYDEYTFEDRMTKISDEENKKKENGEEVPEQDYRTRYLALTEELKGKLASIRNNVNRREEIEKSLAELEGNSVQLSSGEEINRGDWQEVGSNTAGADIAGQIFSGAGNAKSALKKEYGSDQISEKFDYDYNDTYFKGVGIIKIISNLGQMGAEAAKVDVNRKRKVLMDAINATTQDSLIKRVSQYAKTNAQIKEMEAGFNVAIKILNAGTGAAEMTGQLGVAKAIDILGNVLTGIKPLATSSKTRAGVKAGIKDMLGGKDGYYALKSKYKMHAPEMRRAVRDALGVATSEDAVTADKWELSHLMNERVKSGDNSADMERMVDEAGGSTERHFDALQGAGASVRRRFANRQKRMTA